MSRGPVPEVEGQCADLGAGPDHAPRELAGRLAQQSRAEDQKDFAGVAVLGFRVQPGDPGQQRQARVGRRDIVLDESGDHDRLAEVHADGHGEFAAGYDWQAVGGVAGQLRILGVEFQRQRRRVVDMWRDFDEHSQVLEADAWRWRGGPARGVLRQDVALLNDRVLLSDVHRGRLPAHAAQREPGDAFRRGGGKRRQDLRIRQTDPHVRCTAAEGPEIREAGGNRGNRLKRAGLRAKVHDREVGGELQTAAEVRLPVHAHQFHLDVDLRRSVHQLPRDLHRRAHAAQPVAQNHGLVGRIDRHFGQPEHLPHGVGDILQVLSAHRIGEGDGDGDVRFHLAALDRRLLGKQGQARVQRDVERIAHQLQGVNGFGPGSIVDVQPARRLRRREVRVESAGPIAKLTELMVASARCSTRAIPTEPRNQQ